MEIKTVFCLHWRAGSVTADFEMRIADSIEAQDLIAKTERLGTNLAASLILETTGIPPRPATWELGPTRNSPFSTFLISVEKPLGISTEIKKNNF